LVQKLGQGVLEVLELVTFVPQILTLHKKGATTK
jgi:hypothetical protein